jgi:hypothetical protein
MNSLFFLALIKERLLSPDLLEKSRLSDRFFTRNRKMGFVGVILFMLDLSHDSIQTRLNRFFRGFTEEISMSQQAFSKRRNQFTHYPFETMFRYTVSQEYSGAFPLETWNGLHVLAIDGSYLALPDNEDTRAEFGVRGGGKRASAGISVLYDVLHSWALNPIITHTDMNERKELVHHLEWITSTIPHMAADCLVTLDRGYPSKKVIENLETAGVKYLIRCKRKFSKAVDNAPMGSSIIVMAGYLVRVFKLLLPTGDIEILLTNLFECSDESLDELYRLRWCIETHYNLLKNTVCLENFSGKTPNSVRQDFWVAMLFINTMAVFHKEADVVVQSERIDKMNKYQYKARSSNMVVTLRENFIFTCLKGGDDCIPDMVKIMKHLAKSTSPIRPGRHSPRKPVNVKFNLQLKSHL